MGLSTFCGNVYNALIWIGLTLMILNLIAVCLDIAFYIIEMRNQSMSVGEMIFSQVAATIYMGAAIKSCCLCCLDSESDLDKHFDVYNVLTFMAIACAIADGCLKYPKNLTFSIIFFIFAIILCTCLVITCLAKGEAKRDRETDLQRYNAYQGNSTSGQLPSASASSSAAFPKFAMPLYVKKPEVAIPLEMYPINK